VTIVYALVSPGPGRVRRRGVAGESIKVVALGSMSAVVGDIKRVPRPTEDNLRAYDRLLRALAAECAAILPARFGTVFRDADELEQVIRSRQQSLRRMLRHVRNRAQMTIRLPLPATDTGSRRPSRRTGQMTGAEYLASRTTVPGSEALRSVVRRWVRDERVEKRASVASIYHLIPRSSVDAYRAGLDRVAHDAGIRLLVSGPFPPYAFAF